MSRETSPLPIINQDGSLNERVLNKQYGLGTEEAMQEVTFGSHRGTVAEMLNDARCPVGGIVRNAFKERGIDGVLEQLGALSEMDPNFKVEIKDATIVKNKKKIDRPESTDKILSPKTPDLFTPESTRKTREPEITRTSESVVDRVQKTIPTTATAELNTVEGSEPQNITQSRTDSQAVSEISIFHYEKPSEPTDSEHVVFETTETVFDRTPQVVKTEQAVTTPVDLPPVIIEQTPTAAETKQIEDIKDLKLNDIVFVKPAEPKDLIPLIMESTPLEIEEELTTDRSVQIEQESPQLGKKKAVQSIGGAVQAQQEPEDQPVRTEPIDSHGHKQSLRSSLARRVAGLSPWPSLSSLRDSSSKASPTVRSRGPRLLEIDIQLFTGSQDTEKASGGVIRAVKDKGKIIFGIGNTQAEDNEERTDIAGLNPITTVAELVKTLDYINRLTLNIRLKEEQAASEIVIVVSNEILEILKDVEEAFRLLSAQRAKNEGEDNGQALIFFTDGENKEELKIDARQLSQILQLIKDETSESIISSADREMTIDLNMLKKLLNLLKKKRRIDIVNSFKEIEQAPEEIKRNIKPSQSGNNMYIWFIYQTLVFILASVDSKLSNYNLNSPKPYVPEALQA